MRQFRDELRSYLHGLIAAERKELHLTQEQMADYFHMNPRSYSDLEHGKYAFSGVSVMFFLAYLSNDDIIRVVRGFYLYILDVLEGENAEGENGHDS